MFAHGILPLAKGLGNLLWGPGPADRREMRQDGLAQLAPTVGLGLTQSSPEPLLELQGDLLGADIIPGNLQKGFDLSSPSLQTQQRIAATSQPFRATKAIPEVRRIGLIGMVHEEQGNVARR